jgi:hypothetical protein
MNNLNELLEYPGINQFLAESKIYKLYEAYQQIPKSEMEHLWRLVSKYGTLEQFKFVYQKKLLNTTFYESMVNFWYNADVNGWDDIIPYVLESKDVKKLSFILSRGAFKSITLDKKYANNDRDYFDIIFNSEEAFFKVYFQEWTKSASEEDKEMLHAAILEYLITQLVQTLSILNHILSIPEFKSKFLTLKRFSDYLSLSIKNNLLDLFTSIYVLVPEMIEKSHNTNNILFNSILLFSDNIDFCKQAYEFMNHEINKGKHGSINPILTGMLSIKSHENQARMVDFLNVEEYHKALTNNNLHWCFSFQMMCELVQDPILRQCFYVPEVQDCTAPKYNRLNVPLSNQVAKEIFQNESMEHISKLWQILQYLMPQSEMMNAFVSCVTENNASAEAFNQKLKLGFETLSDSQKLEIENALVETMRLELGVRRNNDIQKLLQELYNQTKDSRILIKIFLAVYEHGSEETIVNFLSHDDNLFGYYEFVQNYVFERNFSTSFMVEKYNAKKLNTLDLPHKGFIARLMPAQQKDYYQQKYKEITRYMDVHREVNQHAVWRNEDTHFISQMQRKKQNNSPLLDGEEQRFNYLMKLRSKPYLKYVENGVTISLARGLSINSNKNNASKQMIIDTFDYYLKNQEQECLRIAQKQSQRGLWGLFEKPTTDLIDPAFFHNLLKCSSIATLLPLSFEENQNRLLDTLKACPNMQDYLKTLFDNDEFYKRGMDKNFYVTPPNQQNNELRDNELRRQDYNSHVSFTREQIDGMAALKRHYLFPAQFDIWDKRKLLKDIFVQRYHAAPLIVNGKVMPLEYCSSLKSDQIKACYKNSLHSVIRYLSVPNTWMNPHSPYADEIRRCAVLEKTQIEALWMFWMAASDPSEEMRPKEIVKIHDREVRLTVEDRIQTYIDAIAQPVRSHNFQGKFYLELAKRNDKDWDHLVDDGKPDNPSCAGGSTQRIYSSVFDHPLLESTFVYANKMIRELKDLMFSHISEQLNLQNYQEIFDAISGAEAVNFETLKQFNMPKLKFDNFKQSLRAKMPREIELPWIYDQLMNHCYTRNDYCHVLTCNDQLMLLANNKINLIVEIISKKVQEKLLMPMEKSKWQEILLDQTVKPEISVEKSEQLRWMDFYIDLENFVETCAVDEDYSAKFAEKFPTHVMPEGFCDELANFVIKSSDFDDVKSLLKAYFPDYEPFNEAESSRLKQIEALELMMHKIHMLDGHIERMVDFSPILGSIRQKLDQLDSLSESACASVANGLF